MKEITAVMLSLAITAGAACARTEQRNAEPSGLVSRIFVDSVGGVMLNGRPIDSAPLADSLRALAAAHVGIVYSRANPDNDPTPHQEPGMRRVMGALVANNLPVRLVRPESLATVGK